MSRRKFSIAALGAICIIAAAFADVTLSHSKFSYHSGDGFSSISKGCSATRVHRKGGPNGAELKSGDCPKKLSGELVATFPGPDGTYDVVAKLWGKNNHSNGGATYWIKVNGSKIAGGGSATGKCQSNCDACKSKSCCTYTCPEKSVAKGIKLKKGDKIIFGGTTSWPCGCNSERGGYYTGFSAITFKGAGDAVQAAGLWINNHALHEASPILNRQNGKIDVSFSDSRNHVFKIFDSRGAKIASRHGIGMQNYQIIVPGAGIYLMKIRVDNTNISKMLIIK